MAGNGSSVGEIAPSESMPKTKAEKTTSLDK
jgi:hypothetical protein